MGKKRQKNNFQPNNPTEIPPFSATLSKSSSVLPPSPEVGVSSLAAPSAPITSSKHKFSRKVWFIQQIKELTLVAVFVLAIIGHLVQGSMVIGESMLPTFNQEVVTLENHIERLINSTSILRDIPILREPFRKFKYFGTNMVIVNKLSWYFQSWNYGDVVILYSPREPKKKLIKRLLAREGDLLKIENQFYTVDIGEVFVAGDNLANSFDSRSFGAIPEGLLQGKVWLQVWPPFPKFIQSEINKKFVHLEKALRNMTETEITNEICQLVRNKWKFSQEAVQPSSVLSDLKVPLPELIKAMENTFFLKASLDKYKYTEQVKKEFVDLSNFSQENLKTLAQIAHRLYRFYSKEFESDTSRKG
ncbi:MAG: S26 family signal peptidase [Planctomycetota bacterium]